MENFSNFRLNVAGKLYLLGALAGLFARLESGSAIAPHWREELTLLAAGLVAENRLSDDAARQLRLVLDAFFEYVDRIETDPC